MQDSNLSKIFKQSNSAKEYGLAYFSYLAKILEKIDLSSLDQIVDLFFDASRESRQIFFIGNGGSAATCNHLANDLQVGIRFPGMKFRAISLADNSSILTALGNDVGFENIFSNQLQNLLNEKDIVVALSASGNSANIVSAVEFAKSKKAIIVGLTGFDGGKLKILSDFSFHVPTLKGEYGPVEDIHLIFDHLVSSYIFFKIRSMETNFENHWNHTRPNEGVPFSW